MSHESFDHVVEYIHTDVSTRWIEDIDFYNVIDGSGIEQSSAFDMLCIIPNLSRSILLECIRLR